MDLLEDNSWYLEREDPSEDWDEVEEIWDNTSENKTRDDLNFMHNCDYNLNSPILLDPFLDLFLLSRGDEIQQRTIYFNQVESEHYSRLLKWIKENSNTLLFAQHPSPDSVVSNIHKTLINNPKFLPLISEAEELLKVGSDFSDQISPFLSKFEGLLGGEFPRDSIVADQDVLVTTGRFLLSHSLVCIANSVSMEERKTICKKFGLQDRMNLIWKDNALKEDDGKQNTRFWSMIVREPCVGNIMVTRDFVILLDSKTVLIKNHLLMVKDVFLARFQSMISIYIDRPFSPERLENLKMIYKKGDQLIQTLGNKGYDGVKLLEPIALDKISRLADAVKPLFPPFLDFRDHVEREVKNFGSRDLVDLYEHIQRIKSPYLVLDAYSVFRHFGHPIIEYQEGLKKLHDQVTLEKEIDVNYSECLGSDLAYKVLKKKFDEDKIWYVEKDLVPNRHPLYPFIRDNTWPPSSVVDNLGDIWAALPLKKCFEIPDIINPSQIYSDKSHSGTRTEVLDWVSRKRQGPVPTKKVLETMLKTPTRNWKEFLDKIDREGLSPEHLIIGLKPKEREIKRIGRYFALLSWELRDYFVVTEWLIKQHFVTLFKGLTMADDYVGVIKKMMNSSQGQGSKDYQRITIANHIDYEKWNNHQRKESNDGVFKVMGRFLGYPNLISRTHEFFQNSWVYYAGRSDVLGSRNGSLVDLSGKGIYFWNGQKGGLEGLRQKGWTTVSYLIIEREAKRRNTAVRVLAQGDNQVITPQYRTQKYRNENELIENLKNIRKNNDEIIGHIIEGTRKLGLLINNDETVRSTDFLIYGKIPIYHSQILGLPLKRWSRVNCVNNDELPTFSSVVSSVTTNSLTVAHFSPEPTNAIRNHLFFGNLGLNLLFKYSPSLRGSMRDRFPSSDWEDEEVVRMILLYLDPSLGGQTGTNLNRYFIRMFPDPITESLTFWRRIAVNSPSDSKFRRLACFAGDPELKQFEPRDFEKLIEDPAGLNFKRPTSINNILRSEIKKALIKGVGSVKNEVMRESLHYHASEEDRLLRWLMTIQPLFPRFISEFYSSTFHGVVKSLISLFCNSKSIRRVCKNSFKGGLEDIQRRNEIESMKSAIVLKKKIVSNMRCPEIWPCSSSKADDLRKRSWGQTVTGMTVPHPAELLGEIEFSHSCSTCLRKGESSHRPEFVTIMAPYGIGDPLTKGPFSPYLGSHTSEGTSLVTPWEKESTIPIIRKAERLRNSISWFVKEGGEIALSILDNLYALTGEDWSGSIKGFQRTGSAHHRFSCSRVSGGGYTACSPSGCSWMMLTSDTMGRLNEVNLDFMYQSLFVYAQGKLVFEKKNSGNPGVRHVHVACKSCIREITEIRLESSSPFSFRPVFHFLNKWVPNMKDAYKTAPRINLEEGPWDVVDPGLKIFFVSKAMGFLYGSRIVNQIESVDETSLYPLGIVKRLIPECFFWGLSSGLLCSASLGVLHRRTVLEGVKPEQALLGCYSWIVDELVKVDKFLGFISQPSLLIHLFGRRHRPICSYPPSISETSRLLKPYLKELALSLISREAVDRNLSKSVKGDVWVFSDISDFKIVSPYILGNWAFSVFKKSKDNQKKKNDLKEIQGILIKSTTGELGHSINWGELTPFSVYSCRSEIRHSLIDIPAYKEKEMAYDFGPDECFGEVWTRKLHWTGDQAERSSLNVPKKQDPMISSMRLAQLSTGAHYKLRSILRGLNIKYKDFICGGDGSGGLTSALLRYNRKSRGVFNSLMDLDNVNLRGSKPGPPPALLELGSEKDRCVNLMSVWEEPSDLSTKRAWDNFSILTTRYGLNVDLICVDAEVREDSVSDQIELNLMRFISSWIDRCTVIYKSYVGRLLKPSPIISDGSKLFSSVTLSTSEFSSSFTSEVYLVCTFKRGIPGLASVGFPDLKRMESDLKEISLIFRSHEEEFERALKLKRKDMLIGIPKRVLPDPFQELSGCLISCGLISGQAMDLTRKLPNLKKEGISASSAILALVSDAHIHWSSKIKKRIWLNDSQVRKILSLYVSVLICHSIWGNCSNTAARYQSILDRGGFVTSDENGKFKIGARAESGCQFGKVLFLDDCMSDVGGIARSFFLCFGFSSEPLSCQVFDRVTGDYNKGCGYKRFVEKIMFD
ncbi:polymerase [Itacaiunas virus]|uniref:Replicase n=1 Tax=Itacaiunas virus TaxID=490111 RepID=A0A0D3R1A5_9RHAB|nr:polymerase [Itacaiunas virus]AJR28282.1 polymerase [Itacaiunas virus]